MYVSKYNPHDYCVKIRILTYRASKTSKTKQKTKEERVETKATMTTLDQKPRKRGDRIGAYFLAEHDHVFGCGALLFTLPDVG